jgi:hypothetical protein
MQKRKEEKITENKCPTNASICIHTTPLMTTLNTIEIIKKAT